MNNLRAERVQCCVCESRINVVHCPRFPGLLICFQCVRFVIEWCHERGLAQRNILLYHLYPDDKMESFWVKRPDNSQAMMQVEWWPNKTLDKTQ